MPLVKIYIWPGRTKANKQEIIKKITDAVVDAMSVAPDTVTVIISEVPKENWARGGKTYA